MRKPWDDDAAKPGSPTSVEVVLRWLRTPGNYKRWQTEAKKPLIEEIIAELQKEGTSTRSPSAVRQKIFRLQRQYETATIWLKNEGQPAQYCNGTVDDNMKKAVMERCPLYLELMPVFQSTSCNDTDTSNGGDKTTVVERSSGEVDVGGLEEEAKPAKLTTESAQGKRKRAPDVQPRESSATKRTEQVSQAVPVMVQADVIALETNSERRTIYSDERSLALIEFQRRSESRWKVYPRAEHEPHLGEFGAQRLLDRVTESADAIGKLEVEAEAKLHELR
ncbi:hypothetical protein PF005_g156 [Phytophthora fragariae]|uniref:Uncharacterized protein n=2 Tax=Phytophthora fragariae TaxID=53985 RepID=A0A6A4F044_9STRA|nr:hypothetical protein PF003_g20159 [Phytophthora fragariae]KAE8950308.1 hypothetical protein PF009_g155 [Phytophthora fragariae]KAE9021198.1 hypothetical protein PF011_g5064 [Phytophthora fragariae]KAE9140515.1 hypothetical protein PF010_g150 [Phytophthora fragariae]KAE9141501.1 hypothetical protein PF007_g155 [Phytophthora fragariae]